MPVYAGEYTAAECAGRDKYTIDGKEYEECAFCRASCPSRDIFKEPDSGLPLKCDMCESDPTLKEPMCVQWCLADALTYEEREEEAEAETVEELRPGRRDVGRERGWRKWSTPVGRIQRRAKNGDLPCFPVGEEGASTVLLTGNRGAPHFSNWDW